MQIYRSRRGSVKLAQIYTGCRKIAILNFYDRLFGVFDITFPHDNVD